MLKRNEVEEIVTSVLHEHLDGNGFSGSDILIEDDFDGEQMVFVTAHLEKQADVKSLVDSMVGIRNKFLNAEDDRFISVRQKYPGINDGMMSDEDEDDA